MSQLQNLEKPVVIFLSLLLLFLSFFPTFYRYKVTPPDRIFLGSEFYTDDYSIYVSNIYQGQYGRWTLLDKHTSEPHKGTIIHNEYLLWGKLTGLLKIDQITSYHLFRLIMGLILLFVIYQFLKVIFPSHPGKRVLAFLLITFSFGFPKITQTASGTTLSQYMKWLTELDVFFRFVSLPHYLLGNILFLLNLIIFFKFSSSKPLNTKYLILNSLTATLAALIHPVAIVSLIFSYAVYLFIYTFVRFSMNFGAANVFSARRYLIRQLAEKDASTEKMFASQNLLKNEFLAFIITIISAAPVLLYYKYLFNIPPWNHMAAWEGATKYNVPLTDFIGAIGPVFFLAPIGFISLLYNSIHKKLSIVNPSINTQDCPERRDVPYGSSRSRMDNCQFAIILFSWILSFFLLVYFSYPFLHISEVRFMQVFIFIPFAILAAEAVFAIGTCLPRAQSRGLLVLGIFLISLPLYPLSLKTKLDYYKDFSPLIYPYKFWMEGVYFLKDNTPKDSVVLGAYQAGSIIPFTAGNTVYTGHFWATLDRERKEKFKDKFLKGQMSVKEANDFFKNEKIDYLFWGYQEAFYGGNPKNYPFLKQVFTNNKTLIFKFQP